jgi:hypothetical protein
MYIDQRKKRQTFDARKKRTQPPAAIRFAFGRVLIGARIGCPLARSKPDPRLRCCGLPGLTQSGHGFDVREKGHVTPFTANECANYFTNAGYAST